MTDAITSKRKRELLTLDLGRDLRGRVEQIAQANNLSASQTVRMLILKALQSFGSDRSIQVKIPEGSLLDSSNS